MATAAPLVTDKGAAYFACPACEARFMDPAQRPTRAEEAAHYAHHQNRVDDPRYRAFLSRLADPLLAVLGAQRFGLDYGCGPGPALAAMLTEAGHRVALWDPIYAPDRAVLDSRYDFITCTETAEHFHDPAAEFARMAGMLRPGGWLGVMTSFAPEDALFAGWHYRKDPTHVVFYRAVTLGTIARRLGMTCTIARPNVALMRTARSAGGSALAVHPGEPVA